MKRVLMKLCSLKLTNFKQYKNFSIEFNKGLTGFIRKNNSEKYIIFDAIFFALYGDFRNKKSYIENLNNDDKLIVSVELIFEISQGQYKVTREFRDNNLSAKVYLYDSFESTLASGFQEVDKIIKNLIGIGKTTFFHTTFVLKKELILLSQGNNEARKNTIRKLLGLRNIDDIEIKIREKLIKLEKDSKNIFIQLLEADEEKNILKKIVIIESQLKEKDELQLIQKELLLIEQQIRNNTNQIKKISIELDDLKNKQNIYKEKSAILETFSQIEISLREQELYKENFLKKESLLKEQTRLRLEFKKAREEIHELNVDIIEKPSYEKDLEDLTKQIEVVQKSIRQLQIDDVACGEEIAKFDSLINQHKSQLNKLKEQGRKSNYVVPLLNEYDNVLHTLSNEINEVYFNKIKELKEEHLKTVQKKYKTIEYKEELNRIKSEKFSFLKSLDNKIKRLKTLQVVLKDIETIGRKNNENLSKLKDVKYDNVLLNSLQEQCKTMRIEYENVQNLGEQIKNISKYKKDLDFLQNSMVEFTEKKITILHLIELNKHNELIHYDTGKLYSDIGPQKEQDEKEYEVENDQLKVFKEKLDLNKNNKRKIKIIQDNINDYEKIKINLMEFKEKIDSKIIPRISQLASLMYGQLTKGKYQLIELTNDFDFNVYNNSKALQKQLLDDGEMALVGLVLRIAISKTLAELSGANLFGFLAFEDVFVELDKYKQDKIIDAFLSIQEEFGQVFIVSHDAATKKSLEYFLEIK